MARTRFLFLKRHICQVCNRSQVMQEDNILPGVSLKQDGWLVACVTALILQIWSTTEGPSLENTWADLGFGLVVGGNFFKDDIFFPLCPDQNTQNLLVLLEVCQVNRRRYNPVSKALLVSHALNGTDGEYIYILEIHNYLGLWMGIDMSSLWTLHSPG